MKGWRIYGLIFNFIGNALAVYGLAGLVRDGSRLLIFLLGVLLTVVCILILANPTPE